MRNRTLITATAGALLLAGLAVPVQAMASPSPAPAPAPASDTPRTRPAQPAPAPPGVKPDLLRRCLVAAVERLPEPAECVPVRAQVRQVTGGLQPARPRPAVVAEPNFTG